MCYNTAFTRTPDLESRSEDPFDDSLCSVCFNKADDQWSSLQENRTIVRHSERAKRVEESNTSREIPRPCSGRRCGSSGMSLRVVGDVDPYGKTNDKL